MFPLVSYSKRVSVESGRVLPTGYTPTDGSAVFVLGSDKPGVMVRAVIPGEPDYFETSQQGDLLTGTPVNFVRARVFIRAPTNMPKGTAWRFGARVDFDGLLDTGTLGRVIVNSIDKDISLLDLAIPCRGQVVGTNSAISFRIDTAGGFNAQAGPALTVLGYSSITFTVDTVANTFMAAAHGLANGDTVVAKTTGTLPLPLVVNKIYYVVDATADTFRLALTEGGASIDITTAGTGTNSVSTQEQTIGGLQNQEPASVGRVIRITGAATGANNGQFVVTKYISDSSIKIRNTQGTGTDANSGAINWEFFALDLELPGVYIDSVTLDSDLIFRPVVINRSPSPNQAAVPITSDVYLELSDPSDLQNQIVNADIRVRINGVLALSGTTFQAGFDGTNSFFSTGVDNNRTIQINIDPTANFAPSSVVSVQVEARVIGGGTVVYDYTFTTADTVAPQLVTAVATAGRVIRVTWNEAVLSDSATGANDALNPANWVLARESKTLDDGLPSYLPTVKSVVEVAPSVYDLQLNDDLTEDALYRLSVLNIKDLFGNPILQGLPVARTYPFALDCSPAASYLRLPFTGNRKPSEDTFAYAFWVRRKGAIQAGSHAVVLYNEPDYTTGILLNQFGGDLYVYINNGGPPSTVFFGFWSTLGTAWHRVVVYGNRTLGQVSVYVDGVLNATNTIASWSAITVDGATGVGGASSFGGAANFIFADFCFHKGSVITAADVAADYFGDVRMPGLSSRFKLDEGTGTAPLDSVAGSAGVFVGSPVWTSTDTPTILDAHSTIVLTGLECAHAPEGRRFELLEMVPDMNVSEDETRDLEAFVLCVQEVTNVLLCDIDGWTTVLDPDTAPETFVDAMLLDLGNPFAFDLGLNDKRRLIRVLVPIYQEKGTEAGIINAIRFFLGIEVTIEYPAFTGGWFLGVSELGVNNLLSTADLKTRLSFVIISPVVLTATQRDTIIKIAEYMKDARTHLIQPIQEPVVVPPVTDFWIIGQSLLGVDTKLSIATPGLFSGLQLWLASDVGITLVGSDVSQWNDQSGFARHFTAAANRPLFLTSSFAGRQSLEFDPSNSERMEAVATLNDILDGAAFTAFVVFSATAIDTNDGTVANNDAVICSDDGASSAWGLFLKTPGVGQNNAHPMAFDGTEDNIALALTLGAPTLVTFRHDGSLLYAAKNAGTETSVGHGNTTPLTGTLRLGGNAALSQFMSGRIAEIVVYDRDLTLAERTSVNTYLKNKYFITT